MKKQAIESTKYAGMHIIADFWHGRDIVNPKELKKILLQAALESQNTPLEVSIHTFSPQGITGVVLLAESHVAIHTWPEIGYVAIDIFTCGQGANAKKALEFLKKELHPQKIAVKAMQRGKMGS